MNEAPQGKSVEDLLKIAEELEANGDLTPADAREIVDSLKEGGTPKEEESGDIRALLRDMGIPGKVKLGMFGSATARMLLITDANRMVQEAVLKNPQIQDREIYEICKNTNVSENVLRRISDSKAWMKNYIAKLNLVSNPKTPTDVSMKWLKFLRASDLKKLGSSKNISQVVATAAKKRVMEMQKGN